MRKYNGSEAWNEEEAWQQQQLLERQGGWPCSDPSFESDPSNEYSLLWLTHVMNLIFLDPSDEFLTQVVNIGIPKHIVGFCVHASKRGYKIGDELTRFLSRSGRDRR